MNHNFNKLICAGALAAIGFSAWGDTIYNSYPTYNSSSFTMANGQEIGTEIVSSGTWSLDNFTLEYYAPNPYLASTVGVDVRMYANTGTPVNGFAAPAATPFFDSGWFYNTVLGGLPANGFNIITYSSSDLYTDSSINLPPGFTLPSDFTLTVTFTGLGGTNIVEMPLANNPTGQPGSSFGDYWLNNGGGWTLLTNAAPANMVMDLTGTVPEPSVFLLGSLGSALLFGASRLRRKS